MNKYRALVHFMVLGSRAPNTINISWAPEMSWAPIPSKFLVIDGIGSPVSPGRLDGGGDYWEPNQSGAYGVNRNLKSRAGHDKISRSRKIS